jgi:hypothetical protein
MKPCPRCRERDGIDGSGILNPALLIRIGGSDHLPVAVDLDLRVK